MLWILRGVVTNIHSDNASFMNIECIFGRWISNLRCEFSVAWLQTYMWQCFVHDEYRVYSADKTVTTLCILRDMVCLKISNLPQHCVFFVTWLQTYKLKFSQLVYVGSLRLIRIKIVSCNHIPERSKSLQRGYTDNTLGSSIITIPLWIVLPMWCLPHAVEHVQPARSFQHADNFAMIIPLVLCIRYGM